MLMNIFLVFIYRYYLILPIVFYNINHKHFKLESYSIIAKKISLKGENSNTDVNIKLIPKGEIKYIFNNNAFITNNFKLTFGNKEIFFYTVEMDQEGGSNKKEKIIY